MVRSNINNEEIEENVCEFFTEKLKKKSAFTYSKRCLRVN